MQKKVFGMHDECYLKINTDDMTVIKFFRGVFYAMSTLQGSHVRREIL